jgi:hypothetical protein
MTKSYPSPRPERDRVARGPSHCPRRALERARSRACDAEVVSEGGGLTAVRRVGNTVLALRVAYQPTAAVAPYNRGSAKRREQSDERVARNRPLGWPSC